jgi:hypothetical protein
LSTTSTRHITACFAWRSDSKLTSDDAVREFADGVFGNGDDVARLEVLGRVHEGSGAAGSAGGPVAVNVTGYGDLHILTLCLIAAEQAGRRFSYRTGASFVRARGCLASRPLLKREVLIGANAPAYVPGPVIVGSHVRRSGEQLDQLLKIQRVLGIEVDLVQMLRPENRTAIVAAASKRNREALDARLTPALYTSRGVVASDDQLRVSYEISQALVDIVTGLKESPGFVVGKGGITSSDVGTQALSARRALVLGQIRPGVPVWRLGPESRFPGMPYIVFPGNVGSAETLAEIVSELRGDAIA